MLAQHFLEQFSRASGKPALKLTPEAGRLLDTHEWRGNVRELENLIERVVAFAEGPLVTDENIAGWLNRPGASPKPAQVNDFPPDGLDLEGFMSSIEKDFLLKALERSRWVKKKAARLLQLNSRSFRYRLEKYAITGGRA